MSPSRRLLVSVAILAISVIVIPAKGADMLAGTWASRAEAGLSSRILPQLVVSPSETTPGQSVTFSGSGFRALRPGSLILDGHTIAKFKTDSQGTFTLTWTLPKTISTGRHMVEARDGGLLASAALTVSTIAATATQTPTPTSPTPQPTPTPGSTLQGAPGAAAPGQLTLTRTFNSVGIELPFTGDDNGNATAKLEFKRAADSGWRQGLPLWRTASTSWRAFYGSALLLDPGTTYDIRVTFTDPDGVSGPQVLTGQVTTRAEDIGPASALTPTHYVDAAHGNDANSGTSPSGAWKTLTKAFQSAPSGAVVQVAPGSYAPPGVTRSAPITLLAQYTAVDDGREPINAGRRSVIEPQTFTTPGSGAWKQVTLTGPGSGKQFTVWKWSSPVSGAAALAWAPDRGTTPRQVASWSKKSGTYSGYTLQTPEGWAEVLYLNQTYHYGFASFGNDIYLRLPGDRNPNDVYVFARPGKVDSILALNGPGIRLSGFEVRLYDLQWRSGASNGVVDHNLIVDGRVTYTGTQGSPPRYPEDHVVQYNRMIQTSLWSTDPQNPGIPWMFVKGGVSVPGAGGGWGRVGEAMEVTAVWGRGGAKRLVVRHNTIEGYFNGVGGYNEGFDRYSQQDTDVFDNLLRQMVDDTFEPEQQAINWRIWDNRVEDVPVGLSTGPVNWGPIYLFRNQFWRLSDAGVAGTAGTGDKGVAVVGFKFSGSSEIPARLFVVHNTFWIQGPVTGAGDGGNQFAGGGPDPERFYLRNNIFRAVRYAFEATFSDPTKWDEDYDYFATTDPSRGLGRYLTIADYRAATGQGAHTNVGGDLHNDPRLRNPSTGDLTLADGSPQIDAGVPVPNISDRTGIDFLGRAPDLGATERQ